VPTEPGDRLQSLISDLERLRAVAGVRGADRREMLEQAAADTMRLFPDLPPDQQVRVAFVRTRLALLRFARDRDRRRSLLTEQATALDPVGRDAAGPDEQAELRELRSRLKAAMVDALTPEQREIIRSHFIGSESIAAIAGRLGISRATASRRLAEAVSLLGRMLDGRPQS
jgi:RNA polymerase sigma factor (sigma-70 family)